MKTKLLLSLLGVSAVTAGLVPALTSCGNKTTFSWKNEDGVPEITPASGNYKDANEATDAYFEAINKDKTLLAKEMIYSLDKSKGLSETLESVDINIKSINKKEHKVSFTLESVINEAVPGNANGYDIKTEISVDNAEFLITKNESGVNVFAPTILHEVYNAYSLQEAGASEEEITKAIQETMSHVDELVNDNSWGFFMTMWDARTPSKSFTQYINCLNIYEYATLLLFDPSYTPTLNVMTLLQYVIESKYFSEVTIG